MHAAPRYIHATLNEPFPFNDRSYSESIRRLEDAVAVQTEEFARLAREHNNANVMCLSGRFVTLEANMTLVDIFLTTEFSAGHHEARVAKIMELD